MFNYEDFMKAFVYAVVEVNRIDTDFYPVRFVNESVVFEVEGDDYDSDKALFLQIFNQRFSEKGYPYHNVKQILDILVSLKFTLTPDEDGIFTPSYLLYRIPDNLLELYF